MPIKENLEFRISEDFETVEAGLDEAGRGCFLGPVVAACVIWPLDDTFCVLDDPLAGMIDDSKKISKKRLPEVAEFIKENALAYGIGIVSESRIDEVNIRNAAMEAMHQALAKAEEKLNFSPDLLLVDGNYFKKYVSPLTGEEIEYCTYVSGDSRIFSIACASILAKCARDQYIHKLVADNPELLDYGIDTNVGYGTLKHREAIIEKGPTKFHRQSFNLTGNDAL
uniref:Ribonuclease HII n=1 Tax=viral metagenome TaxID=1070528 RepID=A0A6C0CLW4_9ZZZZ